MDTVDFTIYTDGSANGKERGGSACIVENHKTQRRYHLLGAFGSSTNNQSEIFATLLGYALVKIISPTQPVVAHLISDSEYVLNSSTKYIHDWSDQGKLDDPSAAAGIKNHGFWKVFLELTKNVMLIGTHVKSHSGHLENTKCDYAAGWARKNIIDQRHSGGHIEIAKTCRKDIVFKNFWYYVDFSQVFHCMNLDCQDARQTAQVMIHSITGALSNDTSKFKIHMQKSEQAESKISESIKLLESANYKRFGPHVDQLKHILMVLKNDRITSGDDDNELNY
jgi:ribonuclease HI